MCAGTFHSHSSAQSMLIKNQEILIALSIRPAKTSGADGERPRLQSQHQSPLRAGVAGKKIEFFKPDSRVVGAISPCIAELLRAEV